MCATTGAYTTRIVQFVTVQRNGARVECAGDVRAYELEAAGVEGGGAGGLEIEFIADLNRRREIVLHIVVEDLANDGACAQRRAADLPARVGADRGPCRDRGVARGSSADTGHGR